MTDGTEWMLTAIVIAAAAILGLAAPRISTAIIRARWAWRCRKPPTRNSGGPLEQWEREELITIRAGRRKTARPERSRT